jgi:hypothetical protein
MAVFKPRIPYASIAIPLENTHNTLVIPLTNTHGHTIAPHQQSLATTGTHHGPTIDNIIDPSDGDNDNTHDADCFPRQDK